MAPIGPPPRILAVDELLTYLRVRFGDAVQLAHAPEKVQGGMDTEVYFISLRGGRLDNDWTHPLVLRVHRAADRADVAHQEAEAQAWCVDRGYPAPRVLLVGTTAEGFTMPVQVMNRAFDAGPAVVCHGDFHPLNVIVDGEAATVIDWTDAGLGDPMGDVARTALLLRVAGVATTAPALRTALRSTAPALSGMYLRAYRQIAPFDPTRFRLWTTLHLLHGWAQVCALHAGLVGSASERTQIPKALAPWLERRHHRAAAQLP